MRSRSQRNLPMSRAATARREAVNALADHARQDWGEIDHGTRTELTERLARHFSEHHEKVRGRQWHILYLLPVAGVLSIPVNLAVPGFPFGSVLQFIAMVFVLQYGRVLRAREKRLQTLMQRFRWTNLYASEQVDMLDQPGALNIIRDLFNERHGEEPLRAPAWWLTERHLAAAAAIPVLSETFNDREIEVAMGLAKGHSGSLADVAALGRAIRA